MNSIRVYATRSARSGNVPNDHPLTECWSLADYIAAINKRLDRAKRNFERFDAEHAEYMGRPSGPYRALAEPQSGSRGDFLVRAKIDAAPDWTLLVADII